MNKEFIPHLILGVRADASPSELTVGFARASKRIRQLDDPPFSTAELTSALSVLESEGQPHIRLFFAVPADTEAIPPKFHAELEGTLYDDPDAALDVLEFGQPDTMSIESRELCAYAHLQRALTHLLEWRWEDALNEARLVSQFSSREQLLDEALNISAAAHVMVGRQAEAVSALTKANQGEWSLPLRCNLAIVFLDTDPLRASAEIAQLVDRARNPEDQLAAALLAVQVWRKSHPEGADDEDAARTIPPTLRSALRTLVVGSMSEEDFWTLGTIVARTDSDWVRQNAFVSSPHANTPSANLLRLRSVGFDNYVIHLCRISGPEGRSWIKREAETIVHELLAGFFSDNRETFAGYTVALLKNGLDCSTLARVNLRIYFAGALEELLDDNSEPLTEIIGWLRDAKRAIDSVTDNPDVRNELRSNCNIAFEVIGRLFGSYREQNFQAVHQAASAIEQQLSTPYGRRTANMAAIRSTAFEVQQWCAETLALLQQITAQMEPSDLRRALQDFCGNVAAVRDFVGSVR